MQSVNLPCGLWKPKDALKLCEPSFNLSTTSITFSISAMSRPHRAVTFTPMLSLCVFGQERLRVEEEEEEEDEAGASLRSRPDVGREEPRKVSELEACLFWGGEQRLRLQITLDVGRGAALHALGVLGSLRVSSSLRRSGLLRGFGAFASFGLLKKVWRSWRGFGSLAGLWFPCWALGPFAGFLGPCGVLGPLWVLGTVRFVAPVREGRHCSFRWFLVAVDV
jgi:hypothetical protein